jgi:non-heme chloroperoxidase
LVNGQTKYRACRRLRRGCSHWRGGDFTEELKSIDVPTLVMHGDDDQIVPYKDAGLVSAKLLKNSTLKIYHGMLTTHANVINQDLIAFVRN